MAAIELGVYGAAGRMGQRVVDCALKDPAFKLVGAYVEVGDPLLGKDAGELVGADPVGVKLSSEINPKPQVIIDFSTTAASLAIIPYCRIQRVPLVLATTGFTPAEKAVIEGAAHDIPLLWAPSMSLAVNIAMKLVRDAATALKGHSSGVDVEIIERHHRFKEDAPSGTALKFGEIVAKQMGQTQHIHGRSGKTGKRPQNEIGYHALRTGDNVGEHTIVFGMLGETLEVSVKGNSRDSYALGALTAARFLVGRKPGLYTMPDALNLK